MKRILVLLGHPDIESFCGELAETYGKTARASGHEVRFLRLGELEFDPILHQGYKKATQALEPDLVIAQEAITWAQHLVFVYPIWWGGMPALLKGFIDRVFLPAFAYKYRRGSSLWDKLLEGRSADLLVTMDAPPWYFRWVQRMPGHHQMKKTILEFCGIAPVHISSFGPIRAASEKQRLRWIDQAMRLARRH
jgi:NAD(P)H dehydrogenase (quinone)